MYLKSKVNRNPRQTWRSK